MKCVYCGQRKGKRKCPALGGDICPQCCGEHRLKTIQCPSDCVHLGGLAVVAGADIPEPEVEMALEPALMGLDAWYLEHKGALAYQDILVKEIFDDAMPTTQRELDALDDIMSVVAGATVYGIADSEKKRAVERYLLTQGRDTKPAEVKALQALAHTRFGVFVVEGKELGGGLVVKDARHVDDDKAATITLKTPNSVNKGTLLAVFFADVGKSAVPISVAIVDDKDADDVADAWRADPSTCKAAVRALVRKTLAPLRPDMAKAAAAEAAAHADPPELHWSEMFDTAATAAIALLGQRAAGGAALGDVSAFGDAWAVETSPLLENRTARDAAKDPSLRRRLHYAVDGIVDTGKLDPVAAAKLEAAVGIDKSDVTYDPAAGPAPLRWLMLHRRERVAAIRGAAIESASEGARLEAEKIELVERRLAQKQRRSVEGLKRLVDEGMTRHQAVQELARRG